MADINECEVKPCSQECTNVYGSYQCYCHRGYQLNDVDGITCEGIDIMLLQSRRKSSTGNLKAGSRKWKK